MVLDTILQTRMQTIRVDSQPPKEMEISHLHRVEEKEGSEMSREVGAEMESKQKVSTHRRAIIFIRCDTEGPGVAVRAKSDVLIVIRVPLSPSELFADKASELAGRRLEHNPQGRHEGNRRSPRVPE
jgi:hypothetical protein